MTTRVAAALLLIASTALAQQPPSPVPAPLPAPVPAQAPATAAPAPQPANDDFTRAVIFGKKYADRKDYPNAYEQFAKADALQPDNPGVLYNMAVLLAKAGRYSEAQSKADRYNQLFPLGGEKTLINRLQFELEFERELQKKRQGDQIYLDLFTRGRFLYSKNDLTAALKQFQEAEQQRPNDPAAIFNQAAIYEKSGDLAKAAERLHRYEDLEADADAKTATQQRVLLLESEIADMKTKIVCAFCGYRLLAGTTWCPRCWHGPYLTNQPVWSSRPCVEGSTATRTTAFSGDRFQKNETLPCLFGGTMREALRYSPAKQRLIQEARKAEGWTYSGEIIQGQRDQLRYVQGQDYLEKIVATATGEALAFTAQKRGDQWLLEREEMLIDGLKVTSRYAFDAAGRIAQQTVDYLNVAACSHLITMVADYTYSGDLFAGARIRGSYQGYPAEGLPQVDWTAQVSETYDSAGRVSKEEVALLSMDKKFGSKPQGKLRDEANALYNPIGIRYNTNPQSILKSGDVCASAGTLILGNKVDLRPFYAMSPNVAMVLDLGVTKASVALTYPDTYSVR
jgi:tetratricopeptide (TPR) repeat protein